MASKCPECGHSLKIWEFRAECPKCGVNIANHKWEERLNDDADFAEHAFAKFHYKFQNFKSAVFGTKLRIVRLVLTFAPLLALLFPLYNFTLNLPFNHSEKSISFLSLILDYLLETDIGSVIKLMGGEVLGEATTLLAVGCVLLILAVVFGVLNFFVLLLSGIKMKYIFNVILNVLATVCWGVAAIFLSNFSTACETLGGGIITNCSLGYGFIIGCVLFFVNVVMNIVVGIGLKKQFKEQPSLNEFIENEIAELRKQS